MKRVFKYLLIFLLGVISTLGVGVFAMSVSAKAVLFHPSNPDWQVMDVQEAIDDLYEKVREESLVISYQIGSNASSFTRMDSRINVGYYQSRYKYFKVIKANHAVGNCSGIYFSKDYDQTSGNIAINQQYELSSLDKGRIMAMVSGSNGCFYDIDIQFYN